MTGRCIGQPISWLALEQLCLGELDGARRAEVLEHLDACEACASCRDQIEVAGELVLPELPALPPVPPPTPSTSWLAGLRGWRAAWAGFATAAVAAAALVVFVVVDRSPSRRGAPDRSVAIKGGEAAIDLVRSSGGSTAVDPGVFMAGDRFKVLFTCPPDAELHVDVLVYQDGEPAFPFAAQRVQCANRVALPGAFRITGEAKATVCVAFGTSPRPRDSLGAASPEQLDDAVCIVVTPAPAPE